MSPLPVVITMVVMDPHVAGFSRWKALQNLTMHAPSASSVFALDACGDGRMVAVGFANGSTRIVDPVSGKLLYNLHTSRHVHLPMTAVKWLPHSVQKYTLVAGSADGSVRWFHATTGKQLGLLQLGDGEGEQGQSAHVYCMAMRHDGQHTVTCGSDIVLRILDNATYAVLATLEGDAQHAAHPGHSNRVFAVKYDTQDSNVIYSGGWDGTVQLWDVRQKAPFASIIGPKICGDALDVSLDGRRLLTGSWRDVDTVEEWDIRTHNRLRVLSSDTTDGMAYCAKYAPDQNMVVVGTSNPGMVTILDLSEVHTGALQDDEIAGHRVTPTNANAKYRMIYRETPTEGSIFAATFLSDTVCIYGGSDGVLHSVKRRV